MGYRPPNVKCWMSLFCSPWILLFILPLLFSSSELNSKQAKCSLKMLAQRSHTTVGMQRAAAAKRQSHINTTEQTACHRRAACIAWRMFLRAHTLRTFTKKKKCAHSYITSHSHFQTHIHTARHMHIGIVRRIWDTGTVNKTIFHLKTS